jgi:adenosylcobinamide-phosphate synthase
MVSTVFGGPSPFLLVLMALAVDAAAGGLTARLLPDPGSLAVRYCMAMDRRLNRPERGPRTVLIRGALAMAVLLLAVLLAGLALEWIGGRPRGGWLIELAVVVTCLRGGDNWLKVRAVRRALEGSGGLEAAREAIAPLTRRQVPPMDGHAVARAAIEHVARAFNRKLVAPVFWYLLMGLPGLLAWRAVEAADGAIGHPGVRHQHFGMTAARLDDALNALPARLAAMLLTAAAPFLATASPAGAVRALRTDARRHPSLNMGWPIAAMAGALGVSLGGPHPDGGVVIHEPWIGDGRARATAGDIGRALALAALAALLAFGGAGLLLALVALL